MPRTSTADSSDIARTVASDASFINEAAQLRARATLTELVGTAPEYRWTYIAPRVARNATAALFDLEQIAIGDVASIAEYSKEALLYANVWESLATLGEAASRHSSLLSAAASYDLAGYQANAICIARRLSRQLQADTRGASPALVLASEFLQRFFVRVRQSSKLLAVEPADTASAGEDLYAHVSNALFATGLDGAASAFLQGAPDAIERAVVVLRLAEEGYARIGFAADANLTRVLRALVPVMWQRSTWHHLKHHRSDNPSWHRYLKLLARGRGEPLLSSSSVSELWPSQVTAVSAGLLDGRSSKIVRMPTSAGKTRVAELAIVDALISEPGAKCIYVAPFRALVSEVEASFATLLADLGFRASSLQGTYESDAFEELLAAEADLLIVTPEKLDLLLRLRSGILDHVVLIVLDEGHLVHDPSRGRKFELLLTRMKVLLPGSRFLLLSAVVPDRTLQDFAQWLGKGGSDVVSSGWRPSVQRVALLDWRNGKGVLRYARSDQDILSEFVPGIVRQRQYEIRNPETGRINRPKFPEDNNKGQVAAETAFEFAKTGAVLIFTTLPRNAVSIGKALQRRLELQRLQGETVPSYFTPAVTRAAAVAAEWLGEEHDVTRLLRSGIAVHHGQLPDPVKAAIETDFRQRRYRVIAATSTLAQGVNLPIRTVIVHSCWRGDSQTQSQIRIGARDYWNIAGRAGRAREETDGTVIHISLREADRADYLHFLGRRAALEPVESAILQTLREIAAQRFTEAALGEALDPEVLAMAVEETEQPTVEDLFGQVVSGSLAAVQAQRAGISLEPLTRALNERRLFINSAVSDHALRRVYSATGLRSDSCERLREHITANANGLQQLLVRPFPNNEELSDLLLNATADINEMAPAIEFPGEVGTLLSHWIDGFPIGELRTAAAPADYSPELLTRYMEDLFSYKLPWGFAGYLRIAKHVLGLEALSTGVQFFPAMVKYGVPLPEAAWAMTAGVPLRRAAIQIAFRFLEEAPDRTFPSFRTWLSGIDTESLHADYGLGGSVLEDVARALHSASRNPMLAPHLSLDTLLPLEAEVRGIAYGARRVAAQRVTKGATVSLERDYDNLIDHNAVRVLSDSLELGFLPRDVAQLLAPELDAGMELTAVIAEIVHGEVPKVSLSLSGRKVEGGPAARAAPQQHRS